jgi:hypothetical protein
MTSSLGEIDTAVKLRDIVTSMAQTTVEKLRPAERIGKVYSVDYTRKVAKIYFPGDTADSLIEARFAADKIPTEQMITTFATAGYNAVGNIVRVAGGPGAYYILDYVSGIPAIDPSARALVTTNTVIINANVAAVSSAGAANTAALAILEDDLEDLEADLLVLTSTTIPGLETDLGNAQADLDLLESTTIPALNTRLTDAEADVASAVADAAAAIAKFPIVTTDITDGAITTPKMTANTINGDRITAGTLNALKIVAGSMTTDRFTANTIDGSVVTTNTLNADRIVAGSITTDRMTANTINGDRINTNTLNADRIVAGSISTDRMTANTINGDRITINTLHGDKIIANTITANALNVIAGGENLLLNSSFENTSSFQTDWAKYDNSGVATSSSTVGRRGGVAARLSWSAAAQIVGFYQTVPGGFKGGVVYTFSCYAKAGGGAVGGTMALAANAPAMTQTWIQNPPLTTDWQRYVSTYSRASDTTDNLYFGIASGYGTAGVAKTLDIDDIQLEEGDLVTAYAPKTSETLPGSITGAMLTADSINGKTITGALIRTAATGKRMEILSDPGDPSKIYFYSGSGTETNPARILASGTGQIQMKSGTTSLNENSHITLTPSQIFITNNQQGGIFLTAGSGADYFALDPGADPAAILTAGGNLSLLATAYITIDAGADIYLNTWSNQWRFSDLTLYLPGGSMTSYSGYHRDYWSAGNRSMYLYGTGIYSTENLTTGCEIFGNYIAWSDERDKKNFDKVQSPLETVRKLTVYDYDTRHGGVGKVDKQGRKEPNKLVRKRGITAQDLQKVAPHLVHDESDDPNTGFGMGIDLYGFAATTLAALLELDKKVTELESKK